MSDEVPSKARIPYESLDEHTAVNAWNLPNVQQRGRVVRTGKQGEKSAKNTPRSGESIEALPASKKPKQLTAEELQQITEEARREGFQQGLREGTEQGLREGQKTGEKVGEQRAYKEAKKDIEALQAELRELCTRLFDPMLQQERQLENLLVDMALNLAKALLDAELNVNPQQLCRLVQKALKCLPRGAGNIQVFVNPKDRERILAVLPEAQRNWAIIADDELSPGGCRVSSDHSLVEYSVEERLAVYLEKVDLFASSESATESLTESLTDYHDSAAEHEHEP